MCGKEQVYSCDAWQQQKEKVIIDCKRKNGLPANGL